MSGAKPTSRAAGAGRYKPYPTYRDSGVEWLGEIPAHWEVKRLKYVAPARISKLEVKPDDAVYVGLEHVESWTGRLLLENQPETVDSVVGSFKAGDVLFGKLRPYLAKVARADFDGVCTSEILPLRPLAGCSQSYLMYELLNAPYIHWLDSLTYGTKMPRVSPQQVAVSSVGLPPKPEQHAIAAFLDRETARIDALMVKKERLIELLQEQRTALITRAVTKGLDPTVPMKDSGVEWLGEIPAHWEVKKWRYCCRVTEGQVAPDDDRYRERILIAPNHIESGTGRILYTETADEQGAISGKYLVAPGDIIYSKIRPALNKVCIADGHWLCSADMYPVAITEKRLEAQFLLYFMLSEPFVRLMVDESMRVAMPKINRDKLSACPLVIPPAAEQCAIAAFLDRETAKLDALIAKVRDAIDRLKELRTALISAAVTGKIDVREAAA
ncbi:MAG TPA: restriction endonuclease subunit S [Nevskiales bacterium]|nr:restriction endonuclease subunit S [Nevskiales bacterium]